MIPNACPIETRKRDIMDFTQEEIDGAIILAPNELPFTKGELMNTNYCLEEAYTMHEKIYVAIEEYDREPLDIAKLLSITTFEVKELYNRGKMAQSRTKGLYK